MSWIIYKSWVINLVGAGCFCLVSFYCEYSYTSPMISCYQHLQISNLILSSCSHSTYPQPRAPSLSFGTTQKTRRWYTSALTTFRKDTEDGRSELELHGFEVAALVNLVATDTMVEEAVALIPSLSRFPESAVDEILELIRSTMIRIVSYG